MLGGRTSRLTGALAACALALWARTAGAEDRVDFTTTWFQEQRQGGQGGLTVIHPQVDFAVDIGDTTELRAGYAADVVTGATASVYSVDAVSTATPFDDLRHAGSFGLTFEGSRSALSFGAAVATERDYNSISVSAAGNVWLPGKNTNLALSYTHNFDEVCDRDNAMATPLERRALTGEDDCAKNVIFGEDQLGLTVWRDISIDTTQATLTQNLSPTLVGQLSVFGQVLRGFQSNPYRRVRVSNVEPQEHVPGVRGRLAVTARLNRYLEPLRSAVHLTARGYSDTWGINSGTFGLGYSQYAGDSLLLYFHGRVYQQTEAAFFKDAFFYDTEGPAGAYFTGDRELAPLRHVVTGAKLSLLSVAESDARVWGVFDELRFNLKADLYFFDELPADDIEANLVGIDRQFLSSNQFLDAFTLQLGLLLRY
jgi:hypothetical protein